MDTENAKTTKFVSRKSTLIVAGVVTLAAGVLIGIGAMKYGGGISTAEAATSVPSNRSPIATTSGSNAAKSAAWNPFQEIDDMQLHMDRMFDQMTARFQGQPQLSLFQQNPGYSLSLRVRDMKDHFEVRAFLPNAKASDVKVSLVGKQTLKVAVSNETTKAADQKNVKGTITEWGQYAQTIELPSPVKTEQMKIDNQNHELLITLPKA